MIEKIEDACGLFTSFWNKKEHDLWVLFLNRGRGAYGELLPFHQNCQRLTFLVNVPFSLPCVLRCYAVDIQACT